MKELSLPWTIHCDSTGKWLLLVRSTKISNILKNVSKMYELEEFFQSQFIEPQEHIQRQIGLNNFKERPGHYYYPVPERKTILYFEIIKI